MVASKAASERWVGRWFDPILVLAHPNDMPQPTTINQPALCSTLVKRLTENDYSVVLRTAAAAQRRAEGEALLALEWGACGRGFGTCWAAACPVV